MAPKFDLLLEFVRENGRICPLPGAWQQLYAMLPNKMRSGNKMIPGEPYVGAAWQGTNDTDKMLLLVDHIEWAKKNGVFPEVNSFLRSLPEKDWYHSWD